MELSDKTNKELVEEMQKVSGQIELEQILIEQSIKTLESLKEKYEKIAEIFRERGLS